MNFAEGSVRNLCCSCWAVPVSCFCGQSLLSRVLYCVQLKTLNWIYWFQECVAGEL
eukprot:COSAG01_NODE_592_length_15109_cov_39.247435_7_plen_56_part_00